MLSTILVPLDGSPLAEQALQVAERLSHAISGRLVLVRSVQVFLNEISLYPPDMIVMATAGELATRLNAELVLLQVVSLPPNGLYAEAGEYLALDPDAVLMQAQRYLAEIARRPRPTVAQVRVRADVGYPAALIAHAAVEEKADLIRMATHGRGRVAPLVLGSGGTDVLPRTNVPLLLVRPASLREPSTPPSSAPERAAEVARTVPVVQTPLSVDELRLLQGGLGELLYKPGGDRDLVPRVRDLRDRLERMERAADAEPIAVPE